MSARDLERILLGYFARDDDHERSFQSLTTVFEHISRLPAWRPEYFPQAVGNAQHKKRLQSLLDNMAVNGLLERNFASADFEPSYRATDQGIYEATIEGAPLVVTHSDGTGFSDGSTYSQSAPDRATHAHEAGEPTITSEPMSFDSRKWTGRRLVLTDEAVILELRLRAEELRDRVYSTRFESNVDSQDLKSLCDGLVAVCKMAEPDLTIIERILAHPKFKYSAALAAAIATIRGALGI